MKKDQERLEKQLAETQAENRRLQDPLQRAREEVAELQKQLANYERDKVSLAVSWYKCASTMTSKYGSQRSNFKRPTTTFNSSTAPSYRIKDL